MENKIKRSKKIGVILLDLFICLILTISTFFLGEHINMNLTSSKDQVNAIQTMQENLTSLVIDSKLSYLKDDDYLAQTSDVAYKYVLSQTYTQIDEEKRSHELFKEIDVINKDSDNLYYYFDVYVIEQNSNFKDANKILTIEQYKEKLFEASKNGENNFYSDEEYPLITSEVAQKLYAYLVEGKSEYQGEYQLIYNGYLQILEETIDQYMELFLPYKNLVTNYNNEIDRHYQQKIVILFSCYLLSLLIVYFIIPSILKDGRTLCMKLFHLKATTVDNDVVTWPFNLIKVIAAFIICLFVPGLASIIVLGGYSGMILLFTYFLDIFNLFSLSTLSILFAACSLFFTFFKKEKKQTFSEFVSLTVIKEDESTKKININGKTFEVKN